MSSLAASVAALEQYLHLLLTDQIKIELPQDISSLKQQVQKLRKEY
jgi:hypothetical protein